MTTHTPSVAETILSQLGGQRFVAMTGARQFVGSAQALAFGLPRGTTRDGSNKVRITLTPLDDYTVETFAVRGADLRPCSTVEHVYADQLRAVFERITGLATSLGTIGGGR